MVYAHDGYQLSLQAATATVSIINTSPTASVTLTSSVVRASDILSWQIEANDVDDEPLIIQVAWSKNQLLTQTSTVRLGQPGVITASVAPERLTRGDIWSAEITVFDSEESVSIKTSSVTILSAQPVIRAARLGIGAAHDHRNITLTYEIEDKDAGDQVLTDIIWLIDGQALPRSYRRVAANASQTSNNYRTNSSRRCLWYRQLGRRNRSASHPKHASGRFYGGRVSHR